MEGLLESKGKSPAAPAADPAAPPATGLEPQLPLSDAMTEVFDIVSQFAGGPVRDDDIVIPGGIVATEFVLAAMLVRGVNLAAEVLGKASTRGSSSNKSASSPPTSLSPAAPPTPSPQRCYQIVAQMARARLWRRPQRTGFRSAVGSPRSMGPFQHR